jgi:hypothetical protein
VRRLAAAAAVVGLVAVGVTTALVVHQQPGASQPSQVTELASKCWTSVGTDGFGSVDVSKSLEIANETGSLPVNCVLHLSHGATLTVRHSQLMTRHLVILDDHAGPEGVHLQILDSGITGIDAGIYVHLSHAADSVSIRRATLSYPRSAWVVINGEGSGSDAGGGRIEVLDSTVSSADPASEGIRFTASENGGVATFTNDTFSTPYSDGLALLLAGSCHITNVRGAPPSCTLPPTP